MTYERYTRDNNSIAIGGGEKFRMGGGEVICEGKRNKQTFLILNMGGHVRNGSA